MEATKKVSNLLPVAINIFWFPYPGWEEVDFIPWKRLRDCLPCKYIQIWLISLGVAHRIIYFSSGSFEFLFSVTELLNRQRAENIFAHYDKTCKGRPEGAYKILLAWMEWKQGYGSLGEVCCALRNHGFEELAESFPPWPLTKFQLLIKKKLCSGCSVHVLVVQKSWLFT